MDGTRALNLVTGFHALVVGLSAISFQMVLLEAAVLLCALFAAPRSPPVAAFVLLIGVCILAAHVLRSSRMPHHRNPSAPSITRWRLSA